jgi:Spy/CpxP family protein refolding chaperone
MKQTIWSSIAAIVLAAAVAIPVIAQPPQRGGGRGPGRGPAPGALFFVLRELNLTDAQREQIRTLTTERRDQGESPSRKVAELRHQLQAAVFADAPDQQKIDELKNSIAAATSAEPAARIDLETRIAQILTPEQRAKARDAFRNNSGGPRGSASGRRPGRTRV